MSSLKSIVPSGKVTRLRLFALVIFCLLTVVVSFSTLAYAATPAEQGQAIFQQKCQGCHTIGSGRLVGPDLKGVIATRDRDWLVSFITTPDKLIGQGDPIAREIVQQYGLPMPNLGITEEDAQAILVYIEAQSAGGKPAPTPTQTTIATPTTVSVNTATGKDLFTGKLALKNGGPACLSCHNVSAIGVIGGGTVGKDLTTAYSNFGETGITSILKTTPFPMMKEIYTAKPLTDEEITGVTTFLKEASSAPSTTYQNPGLFFIIGGVAALLIIGIFQWLWRGRLAGVRRPLVKGGS